MRHNAEVPNSGDTVRRKLPSNQALSCFEAAARHQSFTRAAQELALTQGAVSRQVAALEAFVGVPLFKRGQHGMVLTLAGQDYAKQVQQRLDALERDTIDLMGRQGRGDAVKLATVPTFATRWLIPRLPLLAQEQPELLVHLETSTRPFMFAHTGFDAALYAGTSAQVQQWVGTRADLLVHEEVLPVCSPSLLRKGPLTPQALARLPLLQQTTRTEAWRQWFDAQGIDAPRAMAGSRYELFSMVSVAAAHGLGVALMPTLLIQAELAAGTLVVACPRPLRGQRAYYLVQPAAVERPAVTLLREWLLRQVRNDAASA